jgi:hypothetical protein
MMTLAEWAERWGLSSEAIAELGAVGLHYGATGKAPEETVKAQVRLEAAQKGLYLWRNNVGALVDKTGRAVRYGLANDSHALNVAIKSADLIGIRRRVITSADVGYFIGQFVSIETKAPTWRFNPKDPHDLAQAAWKTLILREGGDAKVVSGPGFL